VVRSSAAVIGIAIGFIIAENTAVILPMLMPELAWIDYLVQPLPYYGVQRVSLAFLGQAEQAEYLWAALICAGTVIAATAAGIIQFNKRDVK
jgi:hypothetical protein